MNREDIISIARMIAGPDYTEAAVDERMLDEFMPIFFAIAAAEREECAKLCEGLFKGNPVPDFGGAYAANCAAAIRARSYRSQQ